MRGHSEKAAFCTPGSWPSRRTEQANSLISDVPASRAVRNECSSLTQPMVFRVAAPTGEEVLTRQQLILQIWPSLGPAVPPHCVRFGNAAHRFPFLLKLVRVKFLINFSTSSSCPAGATLPSLLEPCTAGAAGARRSGPRSPTASSQRCPGCLNPNLRTTQALTETSASQCLWLVASVCGRRPLLGLQAAHTSGPSPQPDHAYRETVKASHVMGISDF